MDIQQKKIKVVMEQVTINQELACLQKDQVEVVVFLRVTVEDLQWKF